MQFSVIIPTYNRENFIRSTVMSVLGQTFGDFEVIVIDDGSTDNSKAIIESIEDSRIKYHYQKNAERSAARNKGISLASGQWICFLDSDDEYLVNHLEILNNYIHSNSYYGILLTAIEKIEQGNRTKHTLLNHNSDNILNEIWNNFILMNTVCIPKEVFTDHLFDERFRIWEDTHLWLRIASSYPVIQLPEYTCIQNIHDSSTVREGMNKVKIKDLNQYITAISDLESCEKVKLYLTETDFTNYRDDKYRMYLYQARQNKQFSISLRIWWKAMINKPSSYLFSELPKIFLNKINIGVHAE